jgi:hypothetical protein
MLGQACVDDSSLPHKHREKESAHLRPPGGLDRQGFEQTMRSGLGCAATQV